MLGKFSICRQSGPDGHAIHIELDDTSSGCRVVDITMTPEQFGEAVTGLSCQVCDFEIKDISRVGKIREIKEEFVPESRARGKYSESDHALRNCAPFIVDGWEPRLSDFGNNHRWKNIDGRGGYTVTFIRFVDAVPGSGEDKK